MIEEKFMKWLNSERVSNEDKQILRRFTNEEKNEAFFKDIEFGTAGMRGIIGPGMNRINIQNIIRATVGFAKYLRKTHRNSQHAGVVISHDNRYMSREFTLKAAEILNQYGIKTYIFASLRPTPELSFAIRELKAAGGIMITASHNPKDNNGFKVYDETGCQLVPQKMEILVNIIEKLGDALDVEIPSASISGENIVLGKEIDDKYVEAVLSIRLNPDLDKKGYKIVFTPQHGTSYENGMRIFLSAGYEIIPVTSQCDPDPAFSGTLSPNPEVKEAYIVPLKVAKENHASLIVMTDPDADRVGVAYLASNGTYRLLNGNESGALLLDYVLKERKRLGLIGKNPIVFNTIVTSQLGVDIAHFYGVEVESVLTGFKFIGEKIALCEKTKAHHFEFGYEESYGCLIAPFARDKDGLQALLLMCEMAVYYHNQELTLDKVLLNIQKELGKYYVDSQISQEFRGPEGLINMRRLLKNFRENPPQKIINLDVVRIEDYLSSTARSAQGIENIALPQSDVIKLFLSDGSTVAIRPSGTEPKCKFYLGAIGKNVDEVNKKMAALKVEITNIIANN